MSLILETIRQEKVRIEYMISKYSQSLEKLPKGYLSERNVNGRHYYYLKYREGKKVVSKYISKKDVDTVKQRLEKRKHIESMLQSLQEELNIAKSALEGNV